MKTVITYGTFDLFHEGHYNILKRAKELGDYLIVGVTGETYDAERGKLSVQDSLATRIENVRKTGFADKIIVEEYLGQKIPDIIKYHVDIFAIGSDWKGKFDHIGKYCQICYLERTKNISSTQLREKTLNIYRYGIATDEMYDNEAVIEPKVVSGIHVESVFAEDETLAQQFAEYHELNGGFSDYEKFLEDVDIVYIKLPREKRYDYVKRAVQKGKHVIVDMPYTMDKDKEEEICKLAGQKETVVMENVLTLYQHAFGQLLWMAKGNEIGDLISIKCSISRNMFDSKCGYDFVDLAYYPVCAITKILGADVKSINVKTVKDADGNINYGLIMLTYENTVATAEVGMDMELDCGMKIIGSKGEIFVPDDWWRVGYFKYKNQGDNRTKHYSSNFEGNGFRYLIQAILQEIKSKNSDVARILPKESETVLDVLNKVKKN